MRPKIHASDAEKQRAYRQRLKERLAGLRPAVPPPLGRKPTRPKRLAAILGDLRAMAGEYTAWLAALPPSLSESDLAEQLHETIEQFDEVIEQLEQVRLPRGFGR